MVIERWWKEGGGITKGHKETFEGHGYVYYLDCGDDFMEIYIYIYMSKLKLYTLNMCSLLYINCVFIMLF